jgi:hypothetical protein
MRKTIAILLIAGIAAALAACEQSPTEPHGRWGTVPHVPLRVLRAAPDKVAVAGHTFTLDAYVWRNFQPISPPGGRPMLAVATLAEADSLAIPQGVDLAFIWVVDGENVAVSVFAEPPQPGWPPHMQVRRVADLPQWGPHIFVDVVVGVTAGDGTMELLADRDVWIERAD